MKGLRDSNHQEDLHAEDVAAGWPLPCRCAGFACAGTKFSFDDARRVQVGMTKAQLQEILFGAPTAVVAKGDQVVWVWSYADAFTGSRSVSFVPRMASWPRCRTCRRPTNEIAHRWVGVRWPICRRSLGRRVLANTGGFGCLV